MRRLLVSDALLFGLFFCFDVKAPHRDAVGLLGLPFCILIHYYLIFSTVVYLPYFDIYLSTYFHISIMIIFYMFLLNKCFNQNFLIIKYFCSNSEL